MKKLCYFLGSLIFLISCENAANVVCTDHIETLQVQILNAQDEIVILDSTYVSRLSDGSQLQFEIDEFSDMGLYLYMTDEYMDDLSTESESIQFEGFKGTQTISQVFTVKSGICHVEKIAGPDTLRLD